MPRLTFLTGLFLIVLGVVTWIATDRASATALIPAFFGVPIALMGALGAAPGRRKMCMHIGVLLALLGGLGAAVQGLPKAAALFQGEAEMPWATGSQLAMFLACALLVVGGVRSFIAARRG